MVISIIDQYRPFWKKFLKVAKKYCKMHSLLWYHSIVIQAGVMELAGVQDSKSCGGDTVWVRPHRRHHRYKITTTESQGRKNGIWVLL